MSDTDDHGLLGMLGRFSEGDHEAQIPLHQIIETVEERGFGMMLFVLTLPAFIPIPVGGALSGPMVALLALQMIIGRHEPWLPRRVLEKGPKRGALEKLRKRLTPVLRPLHALIKPRADWIFENRVTFRLSGVILFALALLLALPIPGTNYVFGLALLLFALAMIERDGWLMILAWCVGFVLIASAVLLSGQIIEAIGAMQDRVSDLWQRIFI